MRHRPPLSSHPWVTSTRARAARIGTAIECGRCASLQLPERATAYKSTAVFDETSLPAGLRRDHTTKRGVWGRVVVEAGEVDYVVASLDHTCTLRPGTDGIIAPEVPHHLALRGPVRLHVEFLRVPADPETDGTGEC